ncbi:MAG: hypothetical protein WDZ94_04850, partial [Patescibacteria group bacterium]
MKRRSEGARFNPSRYDSNGNLRPEFQDAAALRVTLIGLCGGSPPDCLIDSKGNVHQLPIAPRETLLSEVQKLSASQRSPKANPDRGHG